mmetsp:Transcript_21930/g.34354  ORF Transcript_21930/g.34354 Transcript_21930/m.34354 type:complete len:394 (-) Transcript_21930:545-1726(-)
MTAGDETANDVCGHSSCSDSPSHEAQGTVETVLGRESVGLEVDDVDNGVESQRRLASERLKILGADGPESAHRSALADIILYPTPYPEEEFSGQGIVMAAGGQLQVINAYTVIRALRLQGTKLPVELFYAGEGEMSAQAVEVLNDLEVTCLNIYYMEGVDPSWQLRGWQMKAQAVLRSSFEEVLWIDTDSVPYGDVSRLFEAADYTEFGSLFWQDWSTDPHWLTAEFMKSYGVTMIEGEREMEAGQFLISKSRCWTTLQVVSYMNVNWQHYFRRMYGDKDTWRFAFKLTNQRQGLAPFPADLLGRRDPSGRFCGNTMMHKDPSSRPAFLHRTLQSIPGLPTPSPVQSFNDSYLYSHILKLARSSQKSLSVNAVFVSACTLLGNGLVIWNPCGR